MQSGISVEEACRTGALTEKDFSRLCNEDGTVKEQTETTTFSLQDSSSSITMRSDVFLLGGATTLILAAAIIVYLLKKRKKRSGKA